MRRPLSALSPLALASLALLLVVLGLTFSAVAEKDPARTSSAREDYAAWPLLKPEFESTGGGGIMIRGYDPVVADGACRTDFQAVEPNGTVYRNEVLFDAVQTAGGTLCTNGRWRAKDGSAEGTTPFRVFIKDGIKRGM